VISAPAPTGLDKAAPLKRGGAMKETLAKEFSTQPGLPRRLCAGSGHLQVRDGIVIMDSNWSLGRPESLLFIGSKLYW
jgi:hypothetical protein